MRSLLDLDKTQLNRIEAAIAAFERRPPVERQKKIYLLRALENEKQELIQCNPSLRRSAHLKAA